MRGPLNASGSIGNDNYALSIPQNRLFFQFFLGQGRTRRKPREVRPIAVALQDKGFVLQGLH
jgi:hypothetical protein